MKEEKLKQLRVVFKRMLKNFLNSEHDDEDYYKSQDDYIETLANNLVLEVKIRIPNK
ncbi:hypothetical protein ES705_20763 [subsurface metagenome]